MRIIAYTGSHVVEKDKFGGEYIASMTVYSWPGGEKVFDMDSDDGAGDYRGYPANIYADLYLQWEQDEPDVSDLNEEEAEWEQSLAGFAERRGHEDLLPFDLFVLKRSEYETRPIDSAWGWDFVAWVGRCTDFDEGDLMKLEQVLGDWR